MTDEGDRGAFICAAVVIAGAILGAIFITSNDDDSLTTTTTTQSQSGMVPPENVHEHSWGNWVTVVEPEVGKSGQEKRSCSTCNESETREIAALQEDFTKKWFINQYNIAKQQYINELNNTIIENENKILKLEAEITVLKDDILSEIQNINNYYINCFMTDSPEHKAALERASQIFKNKFNALKNNVSALEEEINLSKAEISNPNIDNILMIVVKNTITSSKEIYEYYYRYSDSID